MQVLKFRDRAETINATFVSEGTTPTGSVWAMNPVPMCGEVGASVAESRVHTCPGGTPSNWTNFPYPAAGTSDVTSFTIGDTLRIPAAYFLLNGRFFTTFSPKTGAF